MSKILNAALAIVIFLFLFLINGYEVVTDKQTKTIETLLEGCP